MLAEVNAERSAHQKMVKEFARLEQRYANLEEELKLEQTDPNRIALNKSRDIAAGMFLKHFCGIDLSYAEGEVRDVL